MIEIQSIILGIVEGLTEFIPVSSTGHLILTTKILNLENTDFVKSFNIIIQLGAIFAVLFLYGKEFFNRSHLKKIIAGSIPTAIIGFGFYEIIKNNLLGSEIIVVWALLLGGIILIIFEYFYKGPDVPKEDISEITYKQSFLIGIYQSIAVIPGVSRSAATIIGGLSLGIPRPTIVKFSFLLAVPIILGASILDILKTENFFKVTNLPILSIGFITSFIVALITIKFFMRYVRKQNFIVFGVYRIFISLIFIFFII